MNTKMTALSAILASAALLSSSPSDHLRPAWISASSDATFQKVVSGTNNNHNNNNNNNNHNGVLNEQSVSTASMLA